MKITSWRICLLSPWSTTATGAEGGWTSTIINIRPKIKVKKEKQNEKNNNNDV